LSIREENAIKQYCNDTRFEGWSLSAIYCRLLRDGKLHCHISTFYKYCRLLNITRKQKRFKKNYLPLIASAPLQMLHMDVTLFRTADNVKQYLYVIRDNFSRAIVACSAATQYSAAIACNTLKTVLEKFGLMEKEGTLITDAGSENKGEVMQMLRQPGMLWKKIIAQIDIVQSNSMVEAANKIIKHRFLYKQLVADFEALTNKLPYIIDAYNNTPLMALSAYTPAEVLNGKIPDCKRFEKQFFAARKKRIADNQTFTCTDTC
jgi:transposase InsO family protein